MKKLQKEFEKFNDDIKIDEEAEALRHKRDKLKSDIEEYFPDECAEYGIDINKSDLQFINQGSYKIGTTISGSPVDLDYAVIFPLNIYDHTDPRKLKKAAKKALEIKNVRIPTIKEPCVTVAYHANGNETMHIDFPLYAKYNSSLYLARGKENSDDYKWELADPEGLNDYFLNAFKNNPQLRRIVRYIKKWKQLKYSNASSTHETPPSVGLTIMACQYFSLYKCDEDDDLSSFYNTMKWIRDQFSVSKDIYGCLIGASIKCQLPVVPYSNVYYKMTANYMLTFYKRINEAVNNPKEAKNLSEAHEAAKYIRKVLGDDFTVPAKETQNQFTRNKGEYSFG